MIRWQEGRLADAQAELESAFRHADASGMLLVAVGARIGLARVALAERRAVDAATQARAALRTLEAQGAHGGLGLARAVLDEANRSGHGGAALFARLALARIEGGNLPREVIADGRARGYDLAAAAPD